MGIVSPEVVKEDRDFARVAESDVAPFVRGYPILPSDVVVVSDFVALVSVEGLLADVSMRLVGPLEDLMIVPLQPLLVIVESHRLLLELPNLIHEPLDTILPHVELV